MKKILCIIDILGFGGGAERQMSGLAGFLNAKEYDITLATYHKHNFNSDLKEKYGIESVLIECGSKPWSKFIAVRQFIKKGNYDIVITYKNGTNKIACMAKMSGLNFKLVVSERNTTTNLDRNERLKFFLYQFADSIVPNSHSQAMFICGHYPKLKNNVYVITNFTDIAEFAPRQDKSERHDKIRMLITARIAPQKNVISFMNVVKRLKGDKLPLKIDWFGGIYAGKEEYGKKVFELYNKMDIGDILEFHDATKNIAEEYRKCDIFCLPSYHEGYPNVVCEAMSCGKPIICSDVCDNPYIIEDGVNGLLFNPNDENDMYEKIKSLITLPLSNILSMGNASRRIAEQKFSEDTFVDKYIKLIEAL